LTRVLPADGLVGMKTFQLFAALFLTAATASAQNTTSTQRVEAPATITTERPTSGTQADGGDRNPRLRPAPRSQPAPEGTVWPTNAGKLGGATSHTQLMPTNVEGLIEWRRHFINQPEWRGAWVTRFDWAGRGGRGGNGEEASAGADAIKQRIVEIMENAKKLRLNAVVFQLRGDATTLYPSEYEPWSQLLGGKDPGFDPAKFAIEEAHKRGLEFHAYINPIPCTEERTTAPASQDHVFYRHCMPESAPNWLVHRDGKPMAPNDTYKWFNPNLPEVQTYLRTVILDLVKRYDIDGVHYDRIRLPSPDVSDDQWSKARYAKSNPHKLEYGPWQAENISRFITDLYGHIVEMKPQIKVTGAVWGIYDNTVLPQGEDRATGYSWTSSGLQDYAQDSVGWANAGAMDALIPMIYWDMGSNKPDYDELLATFMSSIHNGRHVYGGQSVFSKEEMIRQVVATNVIGAQGTCPFTLRSISREGMAEFYQKHIYPTEAKVPDMPWKSNPVHGHIIVTVVNAKDEPVTDAQVKLGGREYTYLTTTEGTCAILNVTPGEVEISAGEGAGASQKEHVEAGKVARVRIKLGD